MYNTIPLHKIATYIFLHTCSPVPDCIIADTAIGSLASVAAGAGAMAAGAGAVSAGVRYE